MRAFCTGGCGFIGSHVVDALVERGHEVTVFDNLSTGRKEWLNPKARFLHGDLLSFWKHSLELDGYDAIFHFAANADVRGGEKDEYIDFDQNLSATHDLLVATKRYGIKHFVFASSAVVYGEPNLFPTPEDYAGEQTSMYGASKLGCEAMIQAYSEYTGMTCQIYRFVSWIGERYTHGVVFDFVKKLQSNPKVLELLGDGRQTKSYLYVRDGVEGIITGLQNTIIKKQVYNLGHHESMDVGSLARIVCDEMRLKPDIICKGGKRGWIGDSPMVILDTAKIEKLGWTPKLSIEEGVRRTVRYLLKHTELLERK